MEISADSLPKGALKAGQWLSLGEAARLVGVSAATLRVWADRALVRSFRTAGGHRRFARADLERLVAERGGARAPADLAQQAVQRLRRRLRGPRPAKLPIPNLDEDARSRLRVLGRRLVEIAVRYHQDRHRTTVLEEARYIGGEYADENRRLGLSLTQSLQSFFYHRSRLLESLRDIAPASLSRDQALALVRDVTKLTDAVLEAMVSRYETDWLKAGHGPPTPHTATQ